MGGRPLATIAVILLGVAGCSGDTGETPGFDFDVQSDIEAPGGGDDADDGPGEQTPCATDQDCEDALGATLDACQSTTCDAAAGVCVVGGLPDEQACDDGNPCTIDDACEQGTCSGQPRDCDDDDPCTVDDCDAKEDGGCVYDDAVDTGCDDGDPCTSDDACAAGACAGAPMDCSEFDDPCHTGACDPGTVECVAVPADEGSACDDGSLCTETDQCVAGKCVGTKLDCSMLDEGACLKGKCSEASGSCQQVTANEGNPCNDGDLCTIIDTCAEGICGGTPKKCDSVSSACAVGVCEAETGDCVPSPAPDGAACEDGDGCTEGDTCQGGVCAGGEPVECDDLDACDGTESCDPGTGECVEGTPIDCDDQDACTVDSCAPATGECSYLPAFLDDFDACTVDACDPITGAVSHEPIDCADADACTVDACDPATGECSNPSAFLDDFDACTVDACDPVSGEVSHAAVPCDDGDGCTTDSCDSGAAAGDPCIFTPVKIDDGDPCTVDSCDDFTGIVVHATIPCDDGDPCTVDACDPATGECASTPLSCEDGDLCTANACEADTGACSATALSVDDEDPCTTDACDPDTGDAVHEPVLCDDGDPCTDDACDPATGECVATPAPVDDGDACTDDACDPATGELTHEAITCADDDPCKDFACDPATGACAGTASDISDGDPCTDDLCSPATGVVHLPKSCGDGVPCTADTCEAGTGECLHAPKACDDGNPCTDDSCEAGTGKCLHLPVTLPEPGPCMEVACDPASGAPVETPRVCDDGDLCTADSCDPAQDACSFAVAPCDDDDACTTDACDPGTGDCLHADVQGCGVADCCAPHASPGCTNQGCMAAVCEGAPQCCTGAWGDACVLAAELLCLPCQEIPCGSDAECDLSDDWCFVETCDTDAGLCSFVDLADCGGGDCCAEHAGLGCGEDACMDTVCGADPFCCEAGWDSLCLEAAIAACAACAQPGCGADADCDDGDWCTADTCDPATGECLTEAIPDCGAGDCCGEHGGLACEDAACADLVCGADPFCCQTTWDAACAAAAGDGCEVCSCAGDADCDDGDWCTSEFCDVGTGACVVDAVEGCGAGPCCEASADIGCEDPACMETVCGGDPFCCEATWDIVCADAAIAACAACAPAPGDCCQAGEVGGCEDLACQSLLCDADPFCCNGTWDQICADQANEVCEVCVGVLPGDCCGASLGLGCEDASCTAAVCGADAFCCETVWDDICALQAVDLCPGLCGAGCGADDTPCDDGDPCTEDDTCGDGVCAGAPVACGYLDGPCGLGVCDGAGGCAVEPQSEGEPCDDETVCTLASACLEGVCVGTDFLDCDDGEGCTNDACDPGTGCLHPPKGGPCEDGDACTDGDACQGGVCVPGALTDCGDPGECLVAFCDPAMGCLAEPGSQGGDCTPESPCEAAGTCDGGACIGSPVDCTSLDGECAVGVCDEVSGTCKAESANEGVPCDDEVECTSGDQCTAGQCIGAGMDCSSLDSACEIGVCDGAGGCTTLPRPDGTGCDDDNACTPESTCLSGFCIGAEVQCPAGPCEFGFCDPSTGACGVQPGNDGFPCDDGACLADGFCDAGECVGDAVVCPEPDDPCQVALCDPDTGECGAATAEDDTACDDGDLCTLQTTCQGGVCTPTAGMEVECAAPECAVAACNPGTGQCETTVLDNGASCDDGDACTSQDKCTDGVCDGQVKQCVANNPCKTSTCNPDTGQCVVGSIPPGGDCDDDDPCTFGETCSDGQCVGAAIDCSAESDPCHDGVCDPVLGCTAVPKGDGDPCDDGLLCTVDDTCVGGVCEAGPDVDCSELAGPCANAFCDEADGQCAVAPKSEGAVCDDDNLCTTTATCQAGFCTGTDGVDCSGLGDACADALCDPQTGTCTLWSPVVDGTPCPDESLCDGEETCQLGICSPGTAVDCSAFDGLCVAGLCDEADGSCLTAPLDQTPCDDQDPCTDNDQCSQGFCGGDPIPDCGGPGVETTLCTLSGAAGEVVWCPIQVVRACEAVPATGTMGWTVSWDPAAVRLLTYTDRDQNPDDWPPFYSYPGYGGNFQADGYFPTIQGVCPFCAIKHTYTVGPGSDYSQWVDQMNFAIWTSAPNPDGTTVPLTDAYLGAAGQLVGTATLFYAHFELLADVPAGTPATIEMTELVADDLDVSPFAPYLSDGMFLLDYEVSACE